MKTLTKIKLINWHGFYDETININGSTLFAGENGCGKSSLIDAMYFLLSGGDESKFNSAADEKTTRSITTYMRGRTGTEGKENLRDSGNIITHIALEFYDTLTKRYSIIGVVLEIQDSKIKVGRSFYHIMGKQITDDLFFSQSENEKLCLNYRSLEKILGKENINPLDADSTAKEKIRKNIYSILQLDDKYYELLQKAIAFKPISDISQFVDDFLMPKKNVNIENIRENIRTYNEIQIKISQDKDKKISLEQIIEQGNKYKKQVTEKQLLEGYKLLHRLKENERTLIKAKHQLEISQSELQQAQLNEKNYEEQIKLVNEDIYSLTHSEAYIAKQNIERQLAFETEKSNDLENKVSTLNSHISEAEQVASLLKLTMQLKRHIKTRDYAALMKELNEYKARHELKISELNTEIATLGIEIETLSKTQKTLINEQTTLNQGLPSYKDEVNALINVIKSNIIDEQGNPIKVTPLCEFLEIAGGQEDWRDAIEGYLNTRRFDLFVSEQYYDRALNLYEKYKKERKIFGVGLVNIAKIAPSECQKNSLASKVICANETAQKYVNYIMGNVICVESENDLKKFERSITKTVMVYQNKASRQTKKEFYATPYIGRESRKIRLQAIIEQLESLAEELKAKNERKSALQNLQRKTNESHYSIISQIGNVWEQFEKVKENVRLLKARLNEATKNTTSIDPKIDVQTQLLSTLVEKKTENSSRIRQLYIDIDRTNTKITDAQIALDKLTPLLSALESNSALWNEVNEFYKTQEISEDEYNKKITDLNKSIPKIEGFLPGLMNNYITTFGFDATAEMDSLDVFYQEYNDVVMRDLSQFEEKLEFVKQQASFAFQNSYIAEIRRHIRDEKDNINKLNKILAVRPFGPDDEIYQFKIEKSCDKNFGDYYDIFMSDEDYDAKDLFTSQLSEKHLKLMQDLFALLTQNTQSDKQEKIIRDYTDYRKFMSYDIKITNKRNEVSYFSKITGGQSGGEKQTPFYVIIAASFDQIIHNRYGQTSPGCVVMFDEAFNNMDGSRISSLLQYFSELDMQPLIAVPSKNAHSIIPYVNTAIALIKKHNRIVPRPHIREKK